jgi:hypothetical protein
MEIEICEPTPEQAEFQALFSQTDKEAILCLTKEVEELHRIIDNYKKESVEIEQILGKVLGYPLYKDDPKTFPNATEEDGVCVGIESAWSLAMGAAQTIRSLEDKLMDHICLN